uniref:AlNc14C22G2237 protein n=1 Tax=Albugo laibachii Nc14 TaxID=890382 RepID=F0W5S2_9STRA|nr:AlNc14C22G2237 [Albugo laibachii Nc14]|eukprot:CCA16463.1 AlNc14C22G2237 [Albugo laibachii Nc14]
MAFYNSLQHPATYPSALASDAQSICSESKVRAGFHAHPAYQVEIIIPTSVGRRFTSSFARIEPEEATSPISPAICSSVELIFSAQLDFTWYTNLAMCFTRLWTLPST